MSVIQKRGKEETSLFSLENIYDAYLKCRKNKRNTINALKFEASFIDNIITLHYELNSGTYHPSTSICFVQKKPKLREIFAADFRDRVVHHLLVSHLEPKFERIFIHDSYSCRVGKGVHAAVERLKFFLNKVMAGACRPAWYLKEDIRGFFMNMDKHILYEMICRNFRQKDVLELSRKIIFAKCIDDYRFKGNRSLLDHIPPHKTLFKVGDGKGLPIGNLTSQFFANVYLNELDQFVKHHLKCRYYIRYCDDFVLLSASQSQLEEWHSQIGNFLENSLKLEFNTSQTKLRPVSSGIDFLGYIVRRRYTLVRRRVVNNCKEHLRYFDSVLSRLDSSGKCIRLDFPLDEVERFRSVVASYMGHFRWANAFNLKNMLFVKHPVLRACFMLNKYQITPRYIPPKGSTKFRQAWKWWVTERNSSVVIQNRACFPLWVYGKQAKVLVFYQVGCFYELFNNQAEIAHKTLNLRLVKGLHGFRLGCGFPTGVVSRYIRMSLKNGYHLALITEHKRIDGSVVRRLSSLFRADNHLKVLTDKTKRWVQMELPFV